MEWEWWVSEFPRVWSHPVQGSAIGPQSPPHDHSVPPALNSSHSVMFFSLVPGSLLLQVFAVSLAWDPPRAASDSSGLSEGVRAHPPVK